MEILGMAVLALRVAGWEEGRRRGKERADAMADQDSSFELEVVLGVKTRDIFGWILWG